MVKVFLRGLVFLLPLWLLGVLTLGLYHTILRLCSPITHLLPKLTGDLGPGWVLPLLEVVGVTLLIAAVGALLHLTPVRNFARAVLGRLPLIGGPLRGYFKLEDAVLTGGDSPVVLFDDDEGYSYLALRTGEAEGKVILYCPGFPVLSGNIILAPPERVRPTTLTMAEAMDIFTSLGISRL